MGRPIWSWQLCLAAQLALALYATRATAQAVSNVVNSNDLFFQGWHGSPPGGCVPVDTSRPNAITPDVRICGSQGGFISGLEILNGTYAGFPGVWQVTVVCSDGTRLPTAPASITGHVQKPFLTKLSFPLGMPSVSGRSGNWIDQLLVVPDSRSGGGGWLDQCPDGSVVSGLQAWVTPVNGTAVLGTDCVAGGLRFQCNGTYTTIGTSQPSAPRPDAPNPATAPSPNNPPIPFPPKLAKSSSSTVPVIAASLAGVGGVALLGVLIGCLLVRRRRRGGGENSAAMLGSPPKENNGSYFVARTLSAEKEVETSVSSPLEGQWRAFDWGELSKATNGFHESTIVGEGAFGRVYRGLLPIGLVVAIKQLKGKMEAQQQAEFISELSVLSRVRHRNLAALCGLSTARGNLFLVLDFAKNGSLDAALRRVDHPLSWEVRLNIAIGAARGISYLHNDMRPVIVHRDIKASNILLDEHMEAQVADFGMAKLMGDDVLGGSLLTTNVRGTLGYVAPEYAQLGRVTQKCDVYSFGVLLMEIVTASRAITANSSGMVTSLVERVATHRKEGAAVLLDPRLRGAAPLDQVDRVVAIASACVQDEEMLRPTMSDVLRSLENVSQGIYIGRVEKISNSFGPSDPPSPLGGKGDLQLSWQSNGEGSAPFSLGYEMTKLHVGR